jgi:hypothetical protein
MYQPAGPAGGLRSRRPTPWPAPRPRKLCALSPLLDGGKQKRGLALTRPRPRSRELPLGPADASAGQGTKRAKRAQRHRAERSEGCSRCRPLTRTDPCRRALTSALRSAAEGGLRAALTDESSRGRAWHRKTRSAVYSASAVGCAVRRSSNPSRQPLLISEPLIPPLGPSSHQLPKSGWEPLVSPTISHASNHLSDRHPGPGGQGLCPL